MLVRQHRHLSGKLSVSASISWVGRALTLPQNLGRFQEQLRGIFQTIVCCLKLPCSQSTMSRSWNGVYGRRRWSDVPNIYTCDLTDHSFIELSTVLHNTSVTAVRKTTLLPISVPTLGLTDNDGFGRWTETAKELDVSFSAIPFGPLMSAPRNGDSFSVRTSTEASAWLTGLLKKSDGRRITSQGLKGAALSWCSKAGLSKEVREILGRHSSGVQSTPAVYS